jgi:hypothetical protein
MIQLLTMRWAGRDWRLASRAVDVDGATERYRYQGGLPLLDIEERVEVLGSGSAASLSTDLMLPVDVPRMMERGYSLRGAPVEVAYIDDGDEWEQRRVILRGSVEEASTGRAGEAVGIKITSDPGEDAASYPPATWTCEEGRDFGIVMSWDSVAYGRGYPWVFGRPGVYRKNGIDVNVSGSPAYVVASAGATNYVLISAPPCDLRSGGVRLQDSTTGIEENVPPANIGTYYDENGTAVSLALLADAGPIFTGPPAWTAGDLLYTQWTAAAGQTYRGTGLQFAGDVLRVVLQKSSLPIDWRRTEPVCRSLAWEVGGYWDQATSPWEWVKSNLLPILPVSVVYGPQGIYLVRIETNPRRDMAVYHLRDGLNCVIEGRDVVSDQAVDTVSLHFAVTASKQEPKDSLTLGADRPMGKRVGRMATGRVRRTVLDKPSAFDLTSGVVWSAVTAGQICRSQLALRSAHVVYEASADLRASFLSLGDVVLVTSDAYHADRRPGVVTRIRRETSRVRISVMVATYAG